jgi:hypothetical protein
MHLMYRRISNCVLFFHDCQRLPHPASRDLGPNALGSALPPHISLEQAKNYTSSVLERDVDALGFLRKPSSR